MIKTPASVVHQTHGDTDVIFKAFQTAHPKAVIKFPAPIKKAIKPRGSSTTGKLRRVVSHVDQRLGPRLKTRMVAAIPTIKEIQSQLITSSSYLSLIKNTAATKAFTNKTPVTTELALALLKNKINISANKFMEIHTVRPKTFAFITTSFIRF